MLVLCSLLISQSSTFNRILKNLPSGKLKILVNYPFGKIDLELKFLLSLKYPALFLRIFKMYPFITSSLDSINTLFLEALKKQDTEVSIVCFSFCC